MPRALLIDLDETLVVEEQAIVAAFDATAGAVAHLGIDTAVLALAARAAARELWWAFGEHPYCQRIGISSWEGLWCRFDSDHDSARALRTWAPTYRAQAWARALQAQGVDDDALAAELGERFARERRARHATYPDAEPALRDLKRSRYRLAVVTNGSPCLQREKLAASGLAHFFDAVVVSGDVDTAKPDRAVFDHALALLDVNPADAAMVGDSLEKDIEGALAADLGGAILLDRSGAGASYGNAIATLAELPDRLDRLDRP
jgi:putative hydrolase of the HAD superfamily